MPNTTNFNWPTPADTDLVKDGAAAIRNLGNGIDTSLIDLKGGTTGQILSKASNADMDFTFITPNVGDITEVQAGVGISVASGTGPIPIITNSSTDLITTAGDLLYGTAADTVARLGIGTAGQVLTVNSGATAPEWAAAAGGLPAWTDFTPSSYGAITVGNGTVTARYMESNTTIIAQMKFVFGSTSSISGATFFTLPVAPKTNNHFFSNVYLYDNGAGNFFGSLQVASGGVTYLYAASRPATYIEYNSVNSGLPFTWTNTDEIYATVVYEKA